MNWNQFSDMFKDKQGKRETGKTISNETMVEVFNDFMNKAKENIQRDGDLLPIAALITYDGEITIVGLAGGVDIRQAMGAIGNVAAVGKKMGVMQGVITICDAHMKEMPKEDEVKNYKRGDLAKEGAPETIIGTLTRVGLKPYGMVIPYERDAQGKVTSFKEPKVMDANEPDVKVEFNLLPDWTAA